METEEDTFEGFWALRVDPGLTFCQIAPASYRVTMAAYGETKDSTRSTLRVYIDKMDFVLCSLRPGKLTQQPLNLTVVKGEEVQFSVTGNNPVYLTGNYLKEESDESDEDIDDEELAAFLNAHGQIDGDAATKAKERAELLSLMDKELPSDTDDESFEEEESDEDENEEEEEQEESEDEDEEEEDEEEEEEPAKATSTPEKAKKKVKFADQQAKVEKKEVAKPTKEQPKPTPAADKKEPAKSKKRPAEEEKGAVDKKAKAEETKQTEPEVKDFTKLNFTDTKIGQGRGVKNGDKVGIRYIGRLQNGKVFDKNVSGKPLFVNVGRQEVIKGFDQALVGMKLGGERTVRIPSHLAYGKKGLPPAIPKNANLQFEIKLISLA
ncbi:hypothetical protein VTP01DRAFT_5517 [Rhizomucor pusillus]|uniref:uncharacterized protein n=1 Tax=Rhizomucor pusillus TaxID=4840 RepID=UPI003743D8F1